jgi:predicted DNA-binding protein
MTTQMIVRLDAGTKTKLTKFAQTEGKNTSQVVRELIENYMGIDVVSPRQFLEKIHD